MHKCAHVIFPNINSIHFLHIQSDRLDSLQLIGSTCKRNGITWQRGAKQTKIKVYERQETVLCTLNVAISPMSFSSGPLIPHVCTYAYIFFSSISCKIQSFNYFQFRQFVFNPLILYFFLSFSLRSSHLAHINKARFSKKILVIRSNM